MWINIRDKFGSQTLVKEDSLSQVILDRQYNTITFILMSGEQLNEEYNNSDSCLARYEGIKQALGLEVM